MTALRSTGFYFGLMVIMDSSYYKHVTCFALTGCERARNLMIPFVVWKADNMEAMRTFQIMCVVSYTLNNKFFFICDIFVNCKWVATRWQ